VSHFFQAQAQEPHPAEILTPEGGIPATWFDYAVHQERIISRAESQ